MKCKYILRKTQEVMGFLREAFKGPIGNEYRDFKYHGGLIEGNACIGHFSFNNTRMTLGDQPSNPLVRILIEGKREDVLNTEEKIASMFPKARLMGVEVQ